MISLLPIGRVISVIAVLYAIVSCLILWSVYDESTSFLSAISIGASGSAILNTLLLVTFYFGWEKIWGRYPVLNKMLFPNLNGTWDMVIHWEWEGKKGTSHAKAVIRQNFLNFGMDVEAEDSDSQTLLAKPKKDVETGRAQLYYVFLTTPKYKSNSSPQQPYKGAAILKLALNDNELLQGNYFTSRKTVGYYELKRVAPSKR
ncbi:Cap15 family cyclic dinucleotide receptor domain-containing protein [Vibrio sp. YIC-376]|uniref:Cap15 family cyclic dinucleotide receptor domain-containing protein n=1 Tax=Vibrio sp. YIC-376 TaxID=3136162 RepID=UPI00402ACDFE